MWEEESDLGSSRMGWGTGHAATYESSLEWGQACLWARAPSWPHVLFLPAGEQDQLGGPGRQ